MIKALKIVGFHLPSLSVAVAFTTLSILFGSWIARIPEVQDRLMLSEGHLGIALFGLSAGGLVITPLSSWILSKFRVGKVTSLSTLLFCAAIVLPALSWNLWSLTLALFLVGLANGFMNVSINAAAASVEHSYRLSIMSTCHGLFSLGGMIGAMSAGFIAGLGVPLSVHLATLALLMIIVQLFLRPTLQELPDRDVSGPAFSLPSKALIGLSILAFCFIMGETAIGDWSAVYLRNNLAGSASLAGLGYAGFSFSMAVGRFYGDTMKERWGSARLIMGGGVLGALGLLLVIVSKAPLAAILGFTVVGFGFSIIVPILYSVAAKTPGANPGTAISSVATAGVLGYVIGRPAIGGIAELFGLNIGLAFVACLVLGAALFSAKAMPDNQ